MDHYTVWHAFNTVLIIGLIAYKIRSDMKWAARFNSLKVETQAALDISKGHAQLTEAQQVEIKEVVDTVKQTLASGSSSGVIRTIPEEK